AKPPPGRDRPCLCRLGNASLLSAEDDPRVCYPALPTRSALRARVPARHRVVLVSRLVALLTRLFSYIYRRVKQETCQSYRIGYSKNVAPFQLGEEVCRVHSGIPASKRSTSFWKRGSLRRGSRRLSILMLPNKPCSKMSRSAKLFSSKRKASSFSPSAR